MGKKIPTGYYKNKDTLGITETTGGQIFLTGSVH